MEVPILAVTGFSVSWALFVFQSSLLRSIAFLFRLEFFSAEAEAKFGSHGSPDEESLLKLELWVEPDSRRSPGGVLLRLKLGVKSGSHRSLDESYWRLKLVTEPGSLEVGDGARLP